MANPKHNPLALLGAHVRGSYIIHGDDCRLACSFDGIVESVVIDLHPELLGEIFVAGDYHDLGECEGFQIVAPPATADRSTRPISATRVI